MRLFFRIILTLALLLPAPATYSADTIVVATDYWPPFRIDSDSGLTGIDVELLEKIGQRMGVTFVFRVEPWARALLDMEKGQADVMTGLAKTPERAEYILYTTQKYHQCAPAFYERIGRRGPPITEYEHLLGVLIGYTRGSAYFEPFDSDQRLAKIPATNEHQMLQMVAEGRWDVIIGTDCQVDYDLEQFRLKDKIRKTIYQPDTKVDLYIGFSKRSPFKDRIAEFNTILEELIQDGTVTAIVDKYLNLKQ